MHDSHDRQPHATIEHCGGETAMVRAIILSGSVPSASPWTNWYHPGTRGTRTRARCWGLLVKPGSIPSPGQMLEQLRMITLVVMPSTVPFRLPEHRELYLSGLRLAAGEAT
jgi:hypothetical protein